MLKPRLLLSCGICYRHYALAELSILPAEAAHSRCIHTFQLQGRDCESVMCLLARQVDVLFLHNAAEMSSSGSDVATFWDRLKAAFEWLEGARKRGSIRAYGLATWTCFRVSSGDKGFLGLQKVVELAEKVGGANHGFR